MQYHVYGIGNALVDKEFEVSDEFLEENRIEKGMMSLLDEKAHHELLDKLINSFGLKKRSGGGSAANSIVAISQLGGKTFYACKVADDEHGHFYCDDLHAAGVNTNLKDILSEGHTGKCMVMVTPDAERTMNTFLGITSDFSDRELHLNELGNSGYLYIEGYLVTSDISRAAAIKAKQYAQGHGVKTAMTFSDPSMVTYFRDGIDEILGEGVDILFCNEEECMTFTGKANLEEAMGVLSARARKLVITRGRQGATVLNGEQRTHIDPVPVEAIDTNGAGDMFAGAFLYGITHGLDDAQAGKLASAAASRVVSVFGARLSPEDFNELLAEHT